MADDQEVEAATVLGEQAGAQRALGHRRTTGVARPGVVKQAPRAVTDQHRRALPHVEKTHADRVVSGRGSGAEQGQGEQRAKAPLAGKTRQQRGQQQGKKQGQGRRMGQRQGRTEGVQERVRRLQQFPEQGQGPLRKAQQQQGQGLGERRREQRQQQQRQHQHTHQRHRDQVDRRADGGRALKPVQPERDHGDEQKSLHAHKQHDAGALARAGVTPEQQTHRAQREPHAGPEQAGGIGEQQDRAHQRPDAQRRDAPARAQAQQGQTQHQQGALCGQGKPRQRGVGGGGDQRGQRGQQSESARRAPGQGQSALQRAAEIPARRRHQADVHAGDHPQMGEPETAQQRPVARRHGAPVGHGQGAQKSPRAVPGVRVQPGGERLALTIDSGQTKTRRDALRRRL